MYIRIIVLAYFQYVLSSTCAKLPPITTTNGLIEGKEVKINGKSIHRYMGIPFAEPPIKELRFKKPVPLKNKRPGIYKALDIKPHCMSPFNTSFMSEDCLYLNVWTPNSRSDANLPVMFWIHGGSFIMTSATDMEGRYNIFDGTQLALRDVVVVTANFRLGAFGWLFGGSDDAPGNMGYWDQYMALQWIQTNIKAFGGNPKDVTLFGVSVGSISISAHIISPISRNMFRKAIMESGSSYLNVLSINKERALKFSRGFAMGFFGNAPCANNDWIKCLRNKSADEINLATKQIFYYKYRDTIPFKPIFGDEFVPKLCSEAIEESDFKTDITILSGHQEMEGVSFVVGADQIFKMNGRYNPGAVSKVTENQVYNDIKVFFPTDNWFSDKTIEKIASAYTKGITDSQQLITNAVHAFGDMTLNCPTVIFGAQLVKQSAFSGNVYQYKLTYANSKSMSYGSPWAKAKHLDEQTLVFGRPLQEVDNKWTDIDREISEVFLKTWTDFAKHGKPTLINGQEWPRYSLKSNGDVNVSYVELNPKFENSQNIQVNAYRGDDGYFPTAIHNCLEFWFDIIDESIKTSKTTS